MRYSLHLSIAAVASLLSFAVGSAQTMAVQGVAGPAEQVDKEYLQLWKHCGDNLRRRADVEDTAVACMKLANEADRFTPDSHFVTRRVAYVLYGTALLQVGATGDAAKAGDKAVSLIQQQHDDSAGASAAYFVRGHARGMAGDLPGADADLSTAEASERKVMAAAADVFAKVASAAALKQELEFHSQVLEAMHEGQAAQAKNDEAAKL